MGRGWEAYNPNLIEPEPDPDEVVNEEPDGESETEVLV